MNGIIFTDFKHELKNRNQLMQFQSLADVQSAIPKILEQVPYLKLLVLFGSRARGDNLPSSDWDFALLFDEDLRKQCEPRGLDCFRSWVVLQQILDLGDDEMDWVDLKDASELLAHAIARDGIMIYESTPGVFEEFRARTLMTSEELKAIQHRQKVEIETALKRWGL
jgi:uncharacterized protein